jgi:hypothetical protein
MTKQSLILSAPVTRRESSASGVLHEAAPRCEILLAGNARENVIINTRMAAAQIVEGFGRRRMFQSQNRWSG